MPRLLFEYAKLLRLPGLGGLSIAPVFGALSLTDVGVHISLTAVFILLIFGLLKSIYGFVLNDYADIDLDRLSKDTNNRPLVKGTISKRTALIICFLSLASMFLILFLFFYKPHITFYFGVGCLVLAVIFGTIYDLYGKRFMSSAFIAAAADALIVLVAAFVVSPDGTLSVFTWVIFILVYNQFLFMTVYVGGVKDADHDYILNVKNLALASGVKVTKDKKVFVPFGFKVFGFGIRLFSGIIVFFPFAFYGIDFQIWEILLLSVLVVVVLYLTLKIINIKSLEKRDEIVKLAGIQGVLRYAFVPIMLVSVIGLFYAFILIIFPIVWYMIFSPFTGKKLFRHLM